MIPLGHEVPWSCCLGVKEETMAPPNPYEAFFREAAAGTQDVKWWLLAGMSYETSKFRPEVRGGSGEYGLLQIMPLNAPTCGVDPGDLVDPRTNIMCGALLLQRQFNHVNGVGGAASWADAAKFSMFSNNMGWGNTENKVRSLTVPRTWEKFKAAYGGSYPGKIAWVEKMWARAMEFRGNDWLIYGVVGATVLGAGLLLWATVR